MKIYPYIHMIAFNVKHKRVIYPLLVLNWSEICSAVINIVIILMNVDFNGWSICNLNFQSDLNSTECNAWFINAISIECILTDKVECTSINAAKFLSTHIIVAKSTHVKIFCHKNYQIWNSHTYSVLFVFDIGTNVNNGKITKRLS